MILKQKRGQLTIFIIVALILIGLVGIFFVFRGETIIEEKTQKLEENPELFLESCIKDKVREGIEFISLRGGYVDNKLNINFKFEDEPAYNISYLCYNQGSYLPCVNQKPTFMNDLRNEVKKYISKDVENCFNEIQSSFSKEGYEAIVNYEGFEIEIIPKRIIIQTSSEVSLTRYEETTKQEDIKVEIASKLYELSFIIQELVNQEANFCYSENLGIMLVYPEFSIDKFKTGESTIIYTVDHEESKERFRFAVRGCAIPPGLVV